MSGRFLLSVLAGNWAVGEDREDRVEAVAQAVGVQVGATFGQVVPQERQRRGGWRGPLQGVLSDHLALGQPVALRQRVQIGGQEDDRLR